MKGDPDLELAVFTEALKVSIQERTAFLERMCAGDENLRNKVEALLRAHDRVGDFLGEPAISPTLVPWLREIATSELPDAHPRGHRKKERIFQPRPGKRKGRTN